MRLIVLASIAIAAGALMSSSASAASIDINGHSIDLNTIVIEPNNVDTKGCPSFTLGQALAQKRIVCADGSTIGYSVSSSDGRVTAKLTRLGNSRQRSIRRFGDDQRPGFTHSTWQDQPRPERRFGDTASVGRRYYPGDFPTRPSRPVLYPRPVLVVQPILPPPCGVLVGNVYVRTCSYGRARYRPSYGVRVVGHYGRRRWR